MSRRTLLSLIGGCALGLAGASAAYAISFIDSPSAQCRKIKGSDCAISIAMTVGLLLALAAPAAARLVDCEGRCEDGGGSVMLVQNRCDDATERCVAGCDTSGTRPHPYAQCESTSRARTAPQASPVGDPGGIRVRDGE
jgi:hypothetical protein